ncbi:MAG: hypothetical protein JWO60_3180 [Frankiales bacterium]|nr:hypothetical protein [Frankiales bacterium]
MGSDQSLPDPAGTTRMPVQRGLDGLVHPRTRLDDVVLGQAVTPFGALRATWVYEPRALLVELDGGVVARMTGEGLMGWPVMGRSGADGPALELHGTPGTTRWDLGLPARGWLGRRRSYRADVGSRRWTLDQDRRDGGRDLVLTRDRRPRAAHTAAGMLAWSADAEADDLVVLLALVAGSHPEAWQPLASKLLDFDQVGTE